MKEKEYLPIAKPTTEQFKQRTPR